MKAAFRFIAGNSIVTPVGVAAAMAVALALRQTPCAPYAFFAVLVITLACSTCERP